MEDPTLDYFERYRRVVNEKKEIEVELISLEERVKEKKRSIGKLSNDIDEMRRLITLMIETGMDPVEARMKTDPWERTSSMWEDRSFANHGTLSATGLMSGQATLLSTGSIYPPGLTIPATAYSGAVGAQPTYKYTYPAGANGATGP